MLYLLELITHETQPRIIFPLSAHISTPNVQLRPGTQQIMEYPRVSHPQDLPGSQTGGAGTGLGRPIKGEKNRQVRYEEGFLYGLPSQGSESAAFIEYKPINLAVYGKQEPWQFKKQIAQS